MVRVVQRIRDRRKRDLAVRPYGDAGDGNGNGSQAINPWYALGSSILRARLKSHSLLQHPKIENKYTTMSATLAIAHTNRFRVKDGAAFIAWAATYDVGLFEYSDQEQTYFALYRIIQDDTPAGWPKERLTEDDDECDFLGELRLHLEPSSIAVLLDFEIDKSSLIATVEAIDANGGYISRSLNDICLVAAKEFGGEATPVFGNGLWYGEPSTD